MSRGQATRDLWRPLSLLMLLTTGCASAVDPTRCSSLRPVSTAPAPSSLAHPIDESGVAAFVVAHDSALELPQEARDAQLDWLRDEWRRHFTNLPPGIQTWWYEELKDPVLGFRKGVVAVRRCRVLADLVVLEDN